MWWGGGSGGIGSSGSLQVTGRYKLSTSMSPPSPSSSARLLTSGSIKLLLLLKLSITFEIISSTIFEIKLLSIIEYSSSSFIYNSLDR